jgi:hypothetical protein
MYWHNLIRQAASFQAIGDRARGIAARQLIGACAVVALSAVSGCASKDGIRVPDAATTVTTDKAFALPPPGGPAIVNVIEHHFSNAVRQDIFLFTSASTPGQNVLRISFFGPVGLEYDDQKDMPYRSVRDAAISREMRSDIPGVAMARTAYYVQNNYGPFGYATGKSRSGDTCLYAWQQIRSNANSQSTFQNRGTVQVRLRLCDAHATEQQLLGVMYRYTITGTFPAAGWNPYDAPPKVDASLGATENPIYPGVPSSNVNQPPASFQPQPTVAPVPALRRQRAATATPPASQQRAVLPAPTGPTVPLPTGPQQTSPQPGSTQQGIRPVSSVIVPGPGCATTAAEGSACK